MNDPTGKHYERLSHPEAFAFGAADERRRIRRAIAPHLYELKTRTEPCTLGRNVLCCTCEPCKFWLACDAIDAATKAPRKARKGK